MNIGNRQKRRIHAESVINCGNDKMQVDAAIRTALSEDFIQKITKIKNPYEGEQTSEKMLTVIIQALNNGIDLKKKFFDIQVNI